MCWAVAAKVEHNKTDAIDAMRIEGHCIPAGIVRLRPYTGTGKLRISGKVRPDRRLVAPGCIFSKMRIDFGVIYA
jgi:hypothetical protein